MKLEFREGNIADKKALRRLAVISYGQFEKVLTKEDWNLFYENQIILT